MMTILREVEDSVRADQSRRVGFEASKGFPEEITLKLLVNIKPTRRERCGL